MESALSPWRMLKCTPSKYRIRQCSWPPALTPGLKLVGEALVEATDRTGTGSHSQQGLSDFPNLVSARRGHEHLREPLGDVWFVATVAFKRLGVELTLTISGHFDLLEPTRGCHQIAAVGAVAIAFALGTTFSPPSCNERIQLLVQIQESYSRINRTP